MGLKDALTWGSQFKDSDIYKQGAFNPGLFDASKKMTKKLRPGAFGIRGQLYYHKGNTFGDISAILNDGDMNPCVVVSLEPLLVACYISDFDAVVMQYYPTELAAAKGWTVGTKLISTSFFNLTGPMGKPNKDIDKGPFCNTKYRTVAPFVADLYTENTERLERKKREIPENIWLRTMDLGRQYMADHPGMARNGLGTAYKDAVDISTIQFDKKIVID